MSSLPPVVIMLAAAVLVLALPRIARSAIAVAAPAVVFAQLVWVLDAGDGWSMTWWSLELQPLRVDRLSLVFGYVFALAAFIGGIYAWHLKDRLQQAAALAYAGSSLGAVFAGDLVTLVVFWELMALASAYLVYAGAGERYPGHEQASRAGTRYLFVHVAGGSVLLAGVLWHLGNGGGLAFDAFDSGPAAWLVLIGFAVNAAIPPLHAWLSDAYPEASITGSVFLSAFTTKTAVYVLARGFPGWDLLIVLGVIMALYGVVFAVLENDIRRLLAYHIVSQVGYMVAAVGIGTEMAINGAAAHAFAHVLYKGLLFMGAGAAIYATGRRTLTDLGGIADRMKLVVTLYMVGAFSISAFPLFSGFVSKSMVTFAAEEAHLSWAVFALYVASVGTFLSTTLKLPYFTWFGPRQPDVAVGRVPTGMLVAMVMAAFLCIAIGVYPAVLYDRLPFPVTYEPYTAEHVVHTLELLGFTGLGFWLLLKMLAVKRTVTIDTDWFYRKAGKPVRVFVQEPLEAVFTFAAEATAAVVSGITRLVTQPEAALGGLGVRMPRRAGVSGSQAVLAWLGRPPLGAVVAVVIVTFGVVVLIATAAR